MVQPLSGVLVIDFTTLLPGPLATLMLAEAGAEVIKIERPGGEDMRVMPPPFDGDAAVFALLNRGKKSLVVDLKNASDRSRLRPLLVKIESYVCHWSNLLRTWFLFLPCYSELVFRSYHLTPLAA